MHFSSISECQASSYQAVVIGRGPIGLWSAIQTQLNYMQLNNGKKAHIIALDKYSEYQRSHVLRIKSSSFPKVSKNAPKEYRELVDYFKKTKIIKTNEIEEKLTKVAHALGIDTLVHKIESAEQLHQQFPRAEMHIYADGASSVVGRKQICTGQFAQKSDLNFSVQVKYKVKGEAIPFPIFSKLQMSSMFETFGQEHIGKKDPEAGESAVTLQFFIDEKTFAKMKETATSKNPLNLNDSSEKFDEVMLQYIKEWLKRKVERYGEVRVEGSEKISVINLGYYQSKSFVKKEEKPNAMGKEVFSASVGDAAFGVPFFASCGNGFKEGTKLGPIVAKHITEKPAHGTTKEKLFKNSSEASFADYNSYVARLARWEIFIARVKSSCINTLIFILRLNRKHWKKWTEVHKFSLASASTFSGGAFNLPKKLKKLKSIS